MSILQTTWLKAASKANSRQKVRVFSHTARCPTLVTPGSIDLLFCLSATFDCVYHPFLPQASDFCRRPNSVALKSDWLFPHSITCYWYGRYLSHSEPRSPYSVWESNRTCCVSLLPGTWSDAPECLVQSSVRYHSPISHTCQLRNRACCSLSWPFKLSYCRGPLEPSLVSHLCSKMAGPKLY